MLAIKAFYEDGNIQWIEPPPVQKAEILVVFSVEKEPLKSVLKKSALETVNILDKYRGCIKNPDFDYEKERDEWLDEKYGPFN